MAEGKGIFPRDSDIAAVCRKTFPYIHPQIQHPIQRTRGCEQLDLVKDVPAHCTGVGLDDL